MTARQPMTRRQVGRTAHWHRHLTADGAGVPSGETAATRPARSSSRYGMVGE